jgi:hypothetical protein
LTTSAGRYTIRDEGPGFHMRLLACDPADSENIGRPFGRGLFLIHRFMDQVEFNERGNEITMTHRSRPEDGIGLSSEDGAADDNEAEPRPANSTTAGCGAS